MDKSAPSYEKEVILATHGTHASQFYRSLQRSYWRRSHDTASDKALTSLPASYYVNRYQGDGLELTTETEHSQVAPGNPCSCRVTDDNNPLSALIKHTQPISFGVRR